MPDRAWRALFIMLLLTAAVPASSAAQRGFRVELGEAQDPASLRVRGYLAQARLFEGMTRDLNRWVNIPRPLTLRGVECAASDVRWLPAQASVEVCYRFMIRLTGLLGATDSTRAAVNPAFAFFVLHGVAHAMVDEMDLSTAGGEEQAVDELMALILVHYGGEPGSWLLNSVRTLQRADPGWEQWEHARTHRFTPARLETMACVAYGANPSLSPEYRQRGLLSAARASGCAAAYNRVYNGLGRRLSRHMD